MKPARMNDLHHTINDTLPISVVCKIRRDSETTVVDDADTVTLHVKGSSTTVSITGTAVGDSSGTFQFAPADLNSWDAGTYECEVQVDDGSYIQTIGYGNIILRAEIA